MGAGHSAFAVSARLEMQGMSMAARVEQGMYAEVLHMTSIVVHLAFLRLCYHIANVEKLVHSAGVSMALLIEVACKDQGDVVVC